MDRSRDVRQSSFDVFEDDDGDGDDSSSVFEEWKSWDEVLEERFGDAKPIDEYAEGEIGDVDIVDEINCTVTVGGVETRTVPEEVEDVSGLGTTHVERLERAGFTSVDDLREASQSTLADVLGNALSARVKADVGDLAQDDEPSSGTLEDYPY